MEQIEVTDTTFQSLFPQKYVEIAFNRGSRPDGRAMQSFRPFLLNKNSVNTCQGSATVKIGNTIVICGIKAELAQPAIMAPEAGFLVANVDLPPHCGGQFKPGAPSIQTQALSQQIMELVSASKVLDLDKLCIVPGESVWVLYADIICLEYDGSLLDACLGSLMAALVSLRLPKVQVEGDQVKTLGPVESLSINRILMSATFGIVGDKIIPDPTYAEEQVGEVFSFLMDNNLIQCGFVKHGGPPVTENDLVLGYNLAKDRIKELVELIK